MKLKLLKQENYVIRFAGDIRKLNYTQKCKTNTLTVKLRLT